MTDTRTFANFIRIVELGSLSRAAELGNVTQSALSQQMAALETEFGTRLLHRSHRGAVPTPAGETLYHHLKAVLQHLDVARHDVMSQEGVLSGTVTVGLPASMAEILATPLFLTARERYPKLQMRIIGLPNRFIPDHLLRGAVDFALIIQPGALRGTEVSLVAEEQVFLMSSPDSPLAATTEEIEPLDLHGLEFVIPSQPHSIRTLIDTELKAAGRGLNVVGEVDNHTAMIDLAGRGHVHSILPWSAIRQAVEEGRIHARPIARLTRQIGLCQLETVPLSLASAAIRALSLTLLEQLIQDGTWRGISLLKGAAECERMGHKSS